MFVILGFSDIYLYILILQLALNVMGLGVLFCNNRKPRMKFDEESDLKLYIDIGR